MLDYDSSSEAVAGAILSLTISPNCSAVAVAILSPSLRASFKDAGIRKMQTKMLALRYPPFTNTNLWLT